MTSSDEQGSVPGTGAGDRVYRSSAGMAGGALLLGLAGWLCVDAIFAGEGRTPWLALAALILLVPLVSAFTLRPAVFADGDRLRVRNPFRVVVLPWGRVASLRSGYSNEVVADSGQKFQLWSIPVSLRARKRAARQRDRLAAGRATGREGRPHRGSGGFGGALSSRPGPDVPEGPARAPSDQAMDELRELWETRQEAESAQGEVTVRWAWEIVGPAATGALLLAILLAAG
ncbi:PH domain-containing protein [Streptomyces sp. NPDC048737]|uniref:PH domain-containing protein n=1 Tax=unclassified Streptomyces TaxID=2593676 RepID=UPI003429D17A